MTEITISGDSLIIKELTEIVNSNKSLRYEKLELLNKIEDLEKEIIKLKQPRQISYDRYISPYGETYQMLLNLDKYIQEIYGHSLFHCSYGGAEEEDVFVSFDEKLAIRRL